MFSYQDDPFRYSPVLGTRPQKKEGPVLAVPFLDNATLAIAVTGRGLLPQAESRARSKSSPNLAQNFRNAPYYDFPARSHSSRVQRPRNAPPIDQSSSPMGHLPNQQSAPPLPSHLSFHASSHQSLRSTPPLRGQKSPLPSRPTPSFSSSIETKPLLDISKRIVLPVIASHAPSHPLPDPYGLSISPQGFSRHVRPMLARSSSDGYSFKKVAAYGARIGEQELYRQSDHGRDCVGDRSKVHHSRNQSTPPQAAKPSFVSLPSHYAPRLPAQLSTPPLRIKQKSDEHKSGDRSPERPAASQESNPISTSPTKSTLHSTPSQSSYHQKVTSIFAMRESETNDTLALGQPFATNSSLSSYVSESLGRTLVGIEGSSAASSGTAPWFTVEPPSPVNNSARRRGLILDPELLPQPMPRSASPSPEPEALTSGSIIADPAAALSVGGAEVSRLNVGFHSQNLTL
ncbi:hypothetical protein DL93DRAFT_1020287 [Clavulina sp. PMI_390]|nr:hypothetical protein DL93DRAFT_1020287 [Clavulina sp. PMI_390]